MRAKKEELLGFGFEQLAGWIVTPFVGWETFGDNMWGIEQSEVCFGRVNFDMPVSYLKGNVT